MISDIKLWELLEKEYSGHNYSCPTDAESFEAAYEQTVWRSSGKPTLNELKIKKAAYDEANAPYKLSRAAEYPPLAEQLDYIYHNGVEAWKTDIIDPIKTRYPKP